MSVLHKHRHGDESHRGQESAGHSRLTMQSFIRDYRLFLETSVIVAGIMLVKLAADHFGYEFINVSGLFTSVIAGGVFVLSIILSGVIADFKESEKIPSDIAAAIESINEDTKSIAETFTGVDVDASRERLVHATQEILIAIKSEHPDDALESISTLSKSLTQMEQAGVPANYIVKLRQDQASIRRIIHRLHYIQTIQFLPSAYILAESIVVLIVALLIFSKLEPWVDGLILTGFVSYLFIFLLKLIRLVETPFKGDPDRTRDDISLFLLRELLFRLEAHERISG